MTEDFAPANGSAIIVAAVLGVNAVDVRIEINDLFQEVERGVFKTLA